MSSVKQQQIISLINNSTKDVARSNAHAVTQTRVVTMDKSLWARQTRFKWIFWITVLISAVLLFSSCKNKGQNQAALNPTDTAGLAAFNAQKTADSLAALKSDGPSNAAANEQQRGSSQSFAGNNGQETDNGQEAGAVKSINDDNGQYVNNNSGGASSDQEANSGTTTTKKKKFSNAAKGALIGAGSGAAVGAIVDKKNRGLGAVIGAAIGGGAGYGIGKHKDNKKAKEAQ